jgi:hypothetical protein
MDQPSGHEKELSWGYWFIGSFDYLAVIPFFFSVIYLFGFLRKSKMTAKCGFRGKDHKEEEVVSSHEAEGRSACPVRLGDQLLLFCKVNASLLKDAKEIDR